MNPQDAQTSALAWLQALGPVLLAAISLYFTLKKRYDDLKKEAADAKQKAAKEAEDALHKAELEKQLALNQQQTEQNTARLNGQSTKIDTILVSLPSPNQPPTLAVAVAGGENASSTDNEKKDQTE